MSKQYHFLKAFALSGVLFAIASCSSTPQTTLQDYRVSVECAAIINLSIGLQQQDRNIPDATLASSRNAWVRKATNFTGFNEQQFTADVTQFGNLVIQKLGGNVTPQALEPFVNRCLYR